MRCDRTEVLPSRTAPHHFGLAFTATGSTLYQAQGVPKLSFSQIYIQQNLTLGHAQSTWVVPHTADRTLSQKTNAEMN